MISSDGMRHCILLLLIIGANLSAQTRTSSEAQSNDSSTTREYIGAHFNYQHNIHQADMTGLPGIPSCCPQYESGSGSGFALGALYELPLNEALFLQLRASFTSHNATLRAREGKGVLINGAPTLAVVEHQIGSRLMSVGLEPLLGFSPFENAGLYVGTHLAYMSYAHFDQKEQLVEPEGTGTFENNRRTRNEFPDQQIPEATSFYAGVLGRLNYKLPLSKNDDFFLVPEVSYTIGLTDVSDGVNWKAGGLRAGAAIQYAIPKPAPPPPPPPPPTPVIPPKPPHLSVSVTASGVDAQGNTMGAARITVEEFESVAVRPLLSYVFFDEGSSVIPSRYNLFSQAEASTFSIDALHDKNTLSIYHDFLNVIGKRMSETPDAKIQITGCNAGIPEAGNAGLSQSRAERVAEYFASVWNISRDRMSIASRDLPASPSRTDDADGSAENRRVEITSNIESILYPLVTRTIERRITPDVIRFSPNIVAEAGLQSWKLDIRHEGKTVHSFSGTKTIDGIIDWAFADDLHGALQQNDVVEYQLSARDAIGQQTQSMNGEIEINTVSIRKKREEQAADAIFSRFNLILFDYDSPQLGARNDRIMERFIRPEIEDNSKIRITGYTDRIGEEGYNRLLSRLRAENASKVLGAKSQSVDGKGETAPLYDNDLPEGRFYNRTVEIDVETPRKR